VAILHTKRHKTSRVPSLDGLYERHFQTFWILVQEEMNDDGF